MLVPVVDKAQVACVEALAREIWTEHYTPIIGPAQVEYMLENFQSSRSITEQMASGMLYFLIGDQPVGYLAVKPGKSDLFLSKIYIRSAERGTGLGRQAVEFIEKMAKDRGLSEITLTVNKHNSGSIKAYEKMEFAVVEEIVQDIGNGYVMDDYRMIKKLS